MPPGWKHVFDGIDGRDLPVSLVHEDSEPLRRMAIFDVLVNNADRKGGHVLEMGDGHRYGVDHGVTFHVEHKLRTVLWGWLGDPVPEDDLAEVLRVGKELSGQLGDLLSVHLTDPEIDAVATPVPPAVRAGRDAGSARVLPGHPVAALLTGRHPAP